MAEEKLPKPNDESLKIIKKIEGLLGRKLEQVAEINWDSRGFTVDQAGAVEGLGLHSCGIDSEKLQALAAILTSLTNLRTLYLSGNKLTDVSVLKGLTNLTTLNLSYSKLTDVSVLKGLTNLTKLGLSENQLTDVSVLKGLTNLTALNLGGNKLTDVSVLKGLTNLTDLNLSRNKLTDVSVLKELMNLTKLDLGYTKLTDFSVLKGLTNLTDLNLSRNELTDFSVLKGLTNLKELNLSRNELTDVSGLKGLTNLSVLFLEENQLTDVSVLKGLTNLTSLILFRNQLTDVSGLKGLTNLTTLNLGGNQLTDVSGLKGLTNLTALYLGGNQLTDVSGLKGLTNLTELNLGDNKLTDVSVLKGLANLTELNLSGNQLTDVSVLKGLTNLTTLNLGDNKLTDVPRELFEFFQDVRRDETYWVDGLNLYGNPLQSPPVEIVKEGRQAVLKYFASLAGEKKRLNETKVLIVGTGGAGKTSLLRRIFGEEFDSEESQTKGIVIRDKRFKNGNEYITAHFWDFGGQVIMHSSHQFFLSQRSLYVLVLDGRREEDVEHWLQLIQTFGGDSPIIIVLNKMDENPGFDVNRLDLMKKYKSILGFHRVSCKDEEHKGIKGKDGVISGIRKAIGKVEMTGSLWGENWLKVRKELQKIKKGEDHFIDSTKYEGICIKAGIKDPEEQEILVDYLNDLGDILHFKDWGLVDMHVLDPHWVTDAVYRIINSPQLAESHGHLRTDDLKEILKKRKKDRFFYPVGKHPYILKLMRKFELCYPMGQDGDVLVPDLQDKQQPVIPSYGNSVLRFYFDYDTYLPSSILPRFTVRLHKEIVDDLRWRTGLVIRGNHSDATAIVKSDTNKKRIYIDVYGDKKREYLSCIRREFFNIHEGFRKLNPEQWIPLPDNEDEAVSYGNLYGHWKAGEVNYFHGKTGQRYLVSQLLDGIETKEERLAGILKEMGVKAEHLRGKSNQDIHIMIQNINGEHAEGQMIGKMRDQSGVFDRQTIEELLRNFNIEELIKILNRKERVDDGN